MNRPRAKARVGPAAEPKAVPAPAPVAGAAVQRPWGRLRNPTVSVVFDDWGILDYQDGQMCVLCTQHDPVNGDPCMRVRRIKRGKRKNRVSGGFTEWLRRGLAFPERTQRAQHMAIELKDLPWHPRDDARTLLMSKPNGREFVRMEGDVPAGESREPPGIY